MSRPEQLSVFGVLYVLPPYFQAETDITLIYHTLIYFDHLPAFDAQINSR